MVINSQKHSYEIVQALGGEGDVLHYLGYDQEGRDIHLISMGQGEMLKEFLPLLSGMGENASFTDLIEYFLEDGVLWMAFAWKKGRSLEAYLKESHPAAERFDLGRRMMEQMILNMMPVCLMPEVLTPGRIIVGEDGSPGFFYWFGGWKDYETVSADRAAECLFALLKLLFQAEEKSGLYPEWNEWISLPVSGRWKGILDIYQSYVNLAPVFALERGGEEKKPGFRERLKKCLPRILTAVKILAGITVLAVAFTQAAGLWKEKVAPVIEAAAVWKAVYVDEETLEAETLEAETLEAETLKAEALEAETLEAETGTGEGEAVSDQGDGNAPDSREGPENGRGERFREDGSLCYRGGFQDGLYDDAGTLYYPDGTVAYQGGFSFGKKEGEGCQYTDTGTIYYEGGYKKDLFEGTGKLYDADTGKLVYEGEFSGGRFDGEGILYDGTTDMPVYTGSFRLGKYNGKGLEYDSSGSLIYEGEYLLGKYHGKGLVYDAATGAVALEGMFRNGVYVEQEVPDAEQEIPNAEQENPDAGQEIPDTEQETEATGEIGPGIQ